MNTSTTMLSPEYTVIASPILNKGFMFLEEMFKEHGWHIMKNQMNWICFSKVGDETTYFEIKIDLHTIHVSIPVKNTPFQYNTSFTDYVNASEYIEQRFRDFIQTSIHM